MFDFELLLIKAANIAGGLAFFGAIAFFLRLLYGPKGLWRASVPKDTLDGPDIQEGPKCRAGSASEDVQP